jgi:hypothetical protein
MLAGLPFPKLRDAVIAHLTAAEGLWLLLGNVPPRSGLMDIGIQMESSMGKLAHKVAVMTGRPEGSELRSTAG